MEDVVELELLEDWLITEEVLELIKFEAELLELWAGTETTETELVLELELVLWSELELNKLLTILDDWLELEVEQLEDELDEIATELVLELTELLVELVLSQESSSTIISWV